MKVMLLAAGYGTRMRPLTLERPKPLLEAAGKPLIVHHVERLALAGYRELVINTGWLGEQLETALGNGREWGVDITYSCEKDPLETAGGIRHALPLLGAGPFAVINADIWCDYPFRQLSVAANKLAHLVLVDNPRHHAGGDFHLDAKGRVDVVDKPKLTFSGIGVYRSELLELLPDEVKLAPLLRQAMAQGQVSGEHYAGQWWDIGTPERLSELNTFLQSGDH